MLFIFNEAVQMVEHDNIMVKMADFSSILED